MARADAREFLKANDLTYGPELCCCEDCRALWEPVPHDLLTDPDDPLSSFKERCSNCAFRPGSPEQQDIVRWMMVGESIDQCQGFHCHKGVPIEAGATHGYAYPTDGKGKVILWQNRLCRGYLDAVIKKHAVRR